MRRYQPEYDRSLFTGLTANADYHQSGYYIPARSQVDGAKTSRSLQECLGQFCMAFRECHAMRSIYSALCKCAYVLGDLALTASRTKSNLHSNAVFRRAFTWGWFDIMIHTFFLCAAQYNGRGDPWRACFALLCFVEARPLFFLVSFSAYPPAPLTEVPRYSCTFPLVPRGSLTDTDSSLSDLATPLLICRASRWVHKAWM